MDARTVVSVILGNDSDSDWNGSDEEKENDAEEGSFRVDKLLMEQGKMADTCGSFIFTISIIR